MTEIHFHIGAYEAIGIVVSIFLATGGLLWKVSKWKADIEKDLNVLHSDHEEVKGKLEKIDHKFDNIDYRLDKNTERISKIEGKVE